MSAWIAEHWQSNEGLLQESKSGRKRRLLISEDRHEIYIIIGEYGTAYEEYITGRRSLPACADRVPPGSSFDAQANRRAAAGSAAYLRQAEATELEVGGLNAPAVRPGLSRVLRSPPQKKLPPIDEFLVMHQFGPYVVHEADNMQRFIRRLLGLMLQLRGGDMSISYTQQQPSTEFLEQGTARSWPARQPTHMEEFENYAQ